MTTGNEKLLEARAEIEAILHKHDIAGHVVLCMPGFFENFAFYEPSFSRVTFTKVDSHEYRMRVKSQLADYNGDVEAQKRDLGATAGMVMGIGQMLASDAMSLLQFSVWLDEKLGTTHTPLTPVSKD